MVEAEGHVEDAAAAIIPNRAHCFTAHHYCTLRLRTELNPWSLQGLAEELLALACITLRLLSLLALINAYVCVGFTIILPCALFHFS
jgi:hypothetical protein